MLSWNECANGPSARPVGPQAQGSATLGGSNNQEKGYGFCVHTEWGPALPRSLPDPAAAPLERGYYYPPLGWSGNRGREVRALPEAA